MPARKKNKNRPGKGSQDVKASWNQPSRPTPSAEDLASGQSNVLQPWLPQKQQSYYPPCALVHTYNLAGRLPGALVDALHHLDSARFADAGLLAFRGWLEGVVQWRATIGRDRAGRPREDLGVDLKPVDRSGDSEGTGDSWLEAVGPFWMRHLPSLLLPPALHTLTLAVHTLYETVWPELVASSLPLLNGPPSLRDTILGSLFVATYTSHLFPTMPLAEELDRIVRYLGSAIHHPETEWDNMAAQPRWPTSFQSPSAAPGTTPDSSDAKMEERIRHEAFTALGRLLKIISPADAISHLGPLICDTKLWVCLFTRRPPGLRRDEVIGDGQPSLRRRVWMLLGELITYQPQLLDLIRSVVSSAVFEACWIERSPQVVGPMFQSMRQYLTKFPESWMDDHLTAEDCSEDSLAVNGHCASKNLARFLSFLRNGCNGYPVEGYQLAVDAISTVPRHLLSLDSSSLDVLFAALWAAEPALASDPDPSGRQALMRTLQDCANITFGLRSTIGDGQVYADARTYAARQIARTQVRTTLEAQMAELELAVGGRETVDDDMADEDYFLYDGEEEEDDSEGDQTDEDQEDVEVEDDRLSVGSGAHEARRGWTGEDRWTIGGDDASANWTDSLPRADPFAPPAALRILSPSVLSPESVLVCLATHPCIAYLSLPISLPNLFILSDLPPTITHLTLYPSATAPALTDDIEAALIGLPSHLLYLDLRHLRSIFTLEYTLETFVSAFRDNPRIQMVWLPPRPRWRNTPWDGLRDSLNEHLAKNRARQKLMRSAAVRVLRVARAVMLGLDGSEGLGVEELRREVVRWGLEGETGGLTEKQIGRVMDWAGERRTLRGAMDREGFLQEVGCWTVSLDETADEEDEAEDT